jgi:hypothetical protein
MGGDGGVVATNRRYMRGAGSASHTADTKRASASAIAEAERESIVETMKTCSITGCGLRYNEDIVTCPYGKLYGKEAAVKALLRRLEEEKNQSSTDVNGNGNGEQSESNGLGWYIRGLKDLKPVRFQLRNKNTNTNTDTNTNTNTGKSEINQIPIPVCPITSIELNGLQPAFVIVKKKMKKKKKSKDDNDNDNEDQPNVLSEKAIKQMGVQALQEEYGPFEYEDMIRLAPPPGRILDGIKSKLEERRSVEQELNRTKMSSKKKRKHDKSHKNNKAMVAVNSTTNSATTVKKMKTTTTETKNKKSISKGMKSIQTIDDVRNNVAATVASSAALSSLFSDKKQSNLTDKQKTDNLFSCNC